MLRNQSVGRAGRKLAGLFAVLGLVSGCVERDVYSGEPAGVRSVVAMRAETQPEPGFVDVLFVVDDSVSMADKQLVLRSSVQHAAVYAIRCIGDLRHEIPAVNGQCPPGYARTGLLPALGNQAVITTSLDAGGVACAGQSLGAHPVPQVPEQEVLEVHGTQVAGQLSVVGEDGCGFEAPLEAMYRFLVDPEPPLRVTSRSEGSTFTTFAEGIDEELLAQRAAFLHPYSRIAIVILTDEDDCSVKDSGDAWRVGSPSGMTRGASACETDPQSACCRPCDSHEVTPPANCLSISQDPVCSSEANWSDWQDPLNLRCWDQRRRFGEDWLFPVQRYVDALTSSTIVSRSGTLVDNPLFKNGRTPDMISVLTLAGVPWQLITTPESQADDEVMSFLDPQALAATGAWARILGDPETGRPPEDAHLLESPEPRPGLALPGDPLDPVHGHETVTDMPVELQNSCIFELPQPKQCDSDSDSDCSCPDDPDVKSPLCRQPDGGYGTLQRFAKGKPPPRLLEFVRSLGSAGYLGSICPRQLDRPEVPGFGYSDALENFHLGTYGSDWDLSCFYPSLPLRSDGTLKCQLLEFHDAIVDCEALGRRRPSGPYAEAFLTERGWTDRRATTVCEIPAFEGDPRVPGSASYACSHDAQPNLAEAGYCYIDADRGVGDPSLVDACTTGHRRRVRLIPRSTPLAGTTVDLICDYGKD